MREVKRSALVPFTPAQMFALVADIERYPQFVPWVARAQVLERTDTTVVGRLEMNRAGLRETFTTRNDLKPPQRMDLHLVEGPFKMLEGAGPSILSAIAAPRSAWPCVSSSPIRCTSMLLSRSRSKRAAANWSMRSSGAPGRSTRPPERVDVGIGRCETTQSVVPDAGAVRDAAMRHTRSADCPKSRRCAYASCTRCRVAISGRAAIVRRRHRQRCRRAIRLARRFPELQQHPLTCAIFEPRRDVVDSAARWRSRRDTATVVDRSEGTAAPGRGARAAKVAS